ncbi:hypothetical protein [Methanococcoides sp. AM1]|uniref:hypothetical protein n=1 Tax=Methanococcoides sp. AM1 TaxID=1201011 RepID=UPI001083C420|nr:hypothetical protein [Methanococcoides sp. AM1]
MDSQVKCSTCYYWIVENELGGDRGECRRYPPLADTEQHFRTGNVYFPITTKELYCGEWKQRPTKEDVLK